MASQVHCKLCQNSELNQLLSLGPQPVTSRFKDQATEQKFQLEIGQCPKCSLVQIIEPFPVDALVPIYDWLTCTEPEEHLDRLVADTLIKLPGLDKHATVLGLSFKDQSTLDRLKTFGYQLTACLNPKTDLKIANSLASVESVQMAMTKSHITNYLARHEAADMVIGRHIIEHAYDLNAFVESSLALVKPGGYIFFEIPDCLRAFENFDYTTIWEEHTIYFTPQSYRELFNLYDLEIVHFEKVEYPLEDSYVCIARKTNDEASLNRKKINLMVHTQESFELPQRFAQMYEPTKMKYRNFLADFTRNKGKVALFGAAHMGACFINFLELADLIPAVLDDNPHKKSRLMPGSGVPIFSSDYLYQENVKLCLTTLAPRSETAVWNKHESYRQAGGTFRSIFPTNPNYVLK